MTTRVKICGLRDAANLQAAIDAGADFVGFVDYPKSPRHIAPAEAAKLIALLPKHISSVIVTVNPDDKWIKQINFPVSYIQLHGDESPARVAAIKAQLVNTKIIKAISVESAEDIAKATAYEHCADMLLFDTKSIIPSPIRGEVRWGTSVVQSEQASLHNSTPTGERILPGGNGISFDWALLRGKQFVLPWMLSGGLNISNIKEAISQTDAAMVDVSSGVESAAGVKDATLIKQFIEAAKNI